MMRLRRAAAILVFFLLASAATAECAWVGVVGLVRAFS
jgi:hypothetical protein